MKKKKSKIIDESNPKIRGYLLIASIVLILLVVFTMNQQSPGQNRITGNPVIIDGLDGDSVVLDTAVDDGDGDDDSTTSSSSGSSTTMQFMKFEEAKVPSGALGVYTIFPSFMVKIDYNIKEYNDLIEDAKLFLQEVDECEKRIIYPDDEIYDPELIDPDAPKSVHDCIIRKKPLGWMTISSEEEYYNYEIPSTQTVNGVPFNYRLALYFGNTEYDLEEVEIPTLGFARPISYNLEFFSGYIAPGDGNINGVYSGEKINTPSGKQVYGIDVSHWQGDIDWPTLAGTGRQFVFIKASQGANDNIYIDDKFPINVYGASKEGMLVGAYHFATPELNSGAEEAKFFAFILKKKYGRDYLASGYLRPVLDLERGNKMSTPELSKWTNDFMNTFKSETGVEPIIYTSTSYITSELDSSINKYDLWIAQWLTPKPTVKRNWDFWQYTDKGILPGYSGSTYIDLDVFDGDINELKAKFLI